MIYIRVDGNEQIATGHVMRCLSIADGLKTLGEDCAFILADARPADIITGRGFPVHVLDSAWDDMEQEIQTLTDYLKAQKADRLLIDSYFVTEKYLEALRKVVRVAYVDDMRSFIYPVDMIISYGYLAEKTPYEKEYAAYGTRFLLGSSYTPLRKEFQNISYTVKEQVRDVLITTGGTDNFNVAGRVLERICADGGAQIGLAAGESNSYAGLHFHVVLGKFNCNREMLRRLAEDNANITLYDNISNMSELMQRCDLAITAGGSTTYELCAVGVPSICFSIAENQQEGAKAWEENGLMLYAGDMQVDEAGCIDGILKNIQRYRDSFELRNGNSQKMRKLVDGNGALRIARAMLAQPT